MLIDLALVLLCVAVAVLAVTFLQHVFLTVPYIPTPKHVVDAMLDAADLKGTETIYDLGAGDARILIEAKRKFSGVTAKGCELIWVVWLLGKLRIWRSGLPVHLTRESVYAIDVSDADVIFLYLFPSMMTALAKRFSGMVKPGTLIVSHAFRFGGREPIKTIIAAGKKVHVYRW